jgi:mannose-6-phosphate isomerase-like protein (cupin superfamily)
VETELKPHKAEIPAEEFYYILQGRGTMHIDGEEKEVVPGDLVHIPAGSVHGIRVIGTFPLHIFSWWSLDK